ncbi:MFS acetylaranotin efflux transporter ataA, partial [Hyphodiscus hymeniophilus]
ESMAISDPAHATGESHQTSLTETSVGDLKAQELPKMETQEESKESTMTSTAENIGNVKVVSAGEAEIDDEDIEYPHGAKLWIILAALCLAVFLVALDQTIISTAIPKITDHFNSIQDIGWYGSSYLLTATALQPTFGRIYTIFSIKYTFLTAIVIFELGLPIGALAVAVIFLVLKINRDNNPDHLTPIQRILKLDLVGASILVPAVVCLLLALQWGGTTYAWSNSKIIGLFVGFALLTIIFIYSQIKLGDRGTLPPRLFKNRNVVCAFAFACFFGSGFFTLIFYLAIYFQSVQGSSATHAGIQLLPLLISTVLSSIVTGGLITAVGYYAPVMLFCMVLFCIGSGLITTFSINTPLSQWFGYQVITGLGIGVGFQGGVVIVQTVLPLKDVPVATACVSFFQTLGGALFISVAQTLFQNGLLSGIQKNAPVLDAEVFLHSGATEIRHLLAEMNHEDQLDAVLQAYVEGLTHTYWITTACAIVAFVACLGIEWKSVKVGHGQDKNKTKDVEDIGPVEKADDQVEKEVASEKEIEAD